MTVATSLPTIVVVKLAVSVPPVMGVESDWLSWPIPVSWVNPDDEAWVSVPVSYRLELSVLVS